jgi:hypothetical protein
MKTFTGWRAVGRVMWYARKQEDVERTVIGENGRLIEMTWRGPGHSYVGVVDLGGEAVSLTLASRTGGLVDGDKLTAAEALGVLAALGLIPDELARVRDERYGRCKTCGELCTWDSGHDMWVPRWLHCDPFRGQGHRAEVAESNIERKEVP